MTELTGIWTLTVHDIHREADWFFNATNVIVESFFNYLSNTPGRIRREPRRLGFNTFSFNLAGDLAQCLRHARNESEMTRDYLDQVVKTFAVVFNTRVIDLALLDDLPLPGELPDNNFDWSALADRHITQILWAAQARTLLIEEQPIPENLALAITGLSKKELSRFKDGDVKMTTRKIAGVTHFNPAAVQHIVDLIEEEFFAYENYTPF